MGGNGGKAVRLLVLSIMWRKLVSSKLWRLYPQERNWRFQSASGLVRTRCEDPISTGNNPRSPSPCPVTTPGVLSLFSAGNRQNLVCLQVTRSSVLRMNYELAYLRLLTCKPLIRINWEGEPSGYAENLDNWIFLWKQTTLAVCSPAVTIYSMYRRLRDRGDTVVKVLRYKSECRRFDPSWCHWNFSLI